MILDYSVDGVLKVDMRYYFDVMIKEFPYEMKSKVAGPWTEKLMNIDKSAKALNDERKKIFHTFVMKAMFLSKHGQPDVNHAIQSYPQESRNLIKEIARNYFV